MSQSEIPEGYRDASQDSGVTEESRLYTNFNREYLRHQMKSIKKKFSTGIVHNNAVQVQQAQEKRRREVHRLMQESIKNFSPRQKVLPDIVHVTRASPKVRKSQDCQTQDDMLGDDDDILSAPDSQQFKRSPISIQVQVNNISAYVQQHYNIIPNQRQAKKLSNLHAYSDRQAMEDFLADELISDFQNLQG